MACSPADLKKFSEIAKKEIGEADVNLGEAVQKVKELVAEKYSDLQLPPDADNFIERCLRCRKFDVEQAATQVHLFFKFLMDLHTSHDEMYFLPSIHKEYFYDSFGLCLLKHRDSEGRIVIFFNYDRLPVETYSLDKGLAANVLLMDELTRISVDTQRVGIVYVCNFAGYRFGHAKEYTFSRLRSLAKMIQGSFPIRYKGFHVVNAPVLFTYTYSFLKPLLKKKITSRVHIHGSDFTDFHKQVSPSILPDFLGGDLSYEDAVDTDFNRQLCSRDEYYKDLFQYGYMGNNNVEINKRKNN